MTPAARGTRWGLAARLLAALVVVLAVAALTAWLFASAVGVWLERQQRVDRDRDEEQCEVGDRGVEHAHRLDLLAAHGAVVEQVRFVQEPAAEDELALTDVGAEGNLVGSSSTDLGSHLCDCRQVARVDAKIDYQAGTVVMNHPPQSVYQQVIERTKGGFFRTQVLSAAVAK